MFGVFTIKPTIFSLVCCTTWGCLWLSWSAIVFKFGDLNSKCRHPTEQNKKILVKVKLGLSKKCLWPFLTTSTCNLKSVYAEFSHFNQVNCDSFVIFFSVIQKLILGSRMSEDYFLALKSKDNYTGFGLRWKLRSVTAMLLDNASVTNLLTLSYRCLRGDLNEIYKMMQTVITEAQPLKNNLRDPP